MQLNFKSFGIGEPVIIMHGLFGMLDNWQTIARQLSSDFMVFIVDLRNHGRSPHSDRFDYVAMAEDIREFMESNWVYDAHIIGHSMGGKVAMQLAQEYNDMVNKLVVVDIAPKTYASSHQEIFKALLALNLDEISSRSEADKLLESQIPEFAVRQFLLKNLRFEREVRKYSWKMNLSAIYENYQKILEHELEEQAFEGETLFIKGERSKYIEVDEFADYQRFFPQASLKTIKEAGHWVHSEQPQALLEMLKNFLLT